MSVAVLQSFFGPWLTFLAEDPMLRMLQFVMLLTGIMVVFLVFYVTRDILLRTNSFLGMVGSILLVAMLPIAGFFVYLLVRPARTIRERQMDDMIRSLWDHQRGMRAATKSEQAKQTKHAKDHSPAKTKTT